MFIEDPANNVVTQGNLFKNNVKEFQDFSRVLLTSRKYNEGKKQQPFII